MSDSLNRVDSKPVIKADHVRMIFNIASEQLHSLKEYFIKLAKGELHFKEFVALDDISFEIYPGEVYGLVGTNGSGKSTMLKIIAGVLEPSSGSIYAKGVIAPLIELGAGFDMELTARENIYLNGALLGYSKKYIEEHFDDIVDFAEIRHFLEMPLKNYSSGMVARIAFAIATVIVPDILIVDEALSVGDQFFQEKCENRIHELITAYNVTVLFVSHSVDQVRRICDKAIWIEKGQMRMIGDTEDICNIYSYRMEGIQIYLVEKTMALFSSKSASKRIRTGHEDTPFISYSTHVSNIGWMKVVEEGDSTGSFDEENRQNIEAFSIELEEAPYSGSIAYNANIQGDGWQHDTSLQSVEQWTPCGESAGTTGQSKRIEQIQIALTGDLAEHFDVYYRVFSRGFDWMEWKKNGDIAGLEPFVSTLDREQEKHRHRGRRGRSND